MFTVENYVCDNSHGKEYIIFYFDESLDDIESAFDGVKERVGNRCKIFKDSYGLGLKLDTLKNDNEFKEAVKALAEIFDIKSYAEKMYTYFFNKVGRASDMTPNDYKLLMFERIKNCF